MKEKLIALLGLDPASTDDQTVAEVSELLKEYSKLKAADEAAAVSGSREKKIRKKIAESNGALNREQASLVIDHQEQEEAGRKKK